MSVQVSYKKQWLLFLIFLIMIFFITEAYLRIFITDYGYFNYSNPNRCALENSDAYLYLDSKIKKQMCKDSWNLKYSQYHIQYLFPNQHYETININNEGFRGPEITKEKLEGVYRIFAVGGSTTFGWGSTSDSTTIPGFLQQKFDDLELNFNVEVINAGIPAAWSDSEVIYIKHKILDYQPDLLVVYDGYNDNNIRLDRLERSYHDLIEIDSDGKESFLSEIVYSLRKFMIFFKTHMFIENQLHKIFVDLGYYQIDKRPFQGDISQRVSEWVKTWETGCKLGQKEGFETLIVLQPFRGTADRIFTEEYQWWLEHGQPERLLTYPAFSEGLKKLNEFCTATLDLRNVLDGLEYNVYFDRAHMTDRGNELVAEKIYDFTLPFISKND